MNSTNIQTTIAPLVTFLAGILAGKGVFGLDAATWATIVGAILGLGATIWAAVTTRNTAIISQAAALPEVQSIKLEPNAPAATLQATPNNVTK